jgi:hypothetical protein
MPGRDDSGKLDATQTKIGSQIAKYRVLRKQWENGEISRNDFEKQSIENAFATKALFHSIGVQGEGAKKRNQMGRRAEAEKAQGKSPLDSAPALTGQGKVTGQAAPPAGRPR